MELPPPVPLWRRINPVDWLMLVLAIVSVGLLAWETWWDVTDLQRTWVLRVDLIICAIFAVEFLLRWRVSGWRRDFVWRNWYELLGMIPVAHPAIRGFRLFRVIRIIVLLARFGRAADRAFGEAITRRVLSHFTTVIVDTIKRPITVAVLEEVGHVLARGHYTRNIARALEEDVRREVMFPALKQKLAELPPFLRDTEVDLKPRTYYFDRDGDEFPRSRAWAIGGAFTYRSGYWRDAVAVGATLYTSQPLYAPEGEGGTLLLAPGQEG